MHTTLTRIVQRVAAVATLAAGVASAQAGQGVYWAVNIDAPSHGGGRVGTVVSNTPRGVYGHAPVVVAPPVVYVPQPVYHRPPAFHAAPRWHGGHGWWRHRHHGYHRGYDRGYREGHRDARDDGWDDDRGGRGGHHEHGGRWGDR